ncbi:MAG: ribosome recycling factor [bacterium]
MIEEILHQTEERMEKSIGALLREFQTLRAGKATPSFLEKVTVPYYGAPMALSQIATITSPEPRLLVIQPWEQSLLKEVEKAILKANLGVTPQSDGRVVRVAFPPLTQERRRELAKMAKKMAEDSKVELRTHRRVANEELRKLEDASKISEDEQKNTLEKVQKLLDRHIEKVEDALAKKEQQILEV